MVSGLIFVHAMLVKRGHGTAYNTVYAVRYAHANCSTSLRNFAYTGNIIRNSTPQLLE